jgi:predicted DCC family thiol-disulfide oxidoreductase YuxK
MSNQYSVVLFDGVCNFCNSSVNFLIQHDSSKKLRFASLQSEIGRNYLSRFSINNDLNSIILIEDHRHYNKSTAALRICRHLTGWPKLLIILIVIPKPLRNLIYMWFAKRRYTFFGKRDSCLLLPPKEVSDRFL